MDYWANSLILKKKKKCMEIDPCTIYLRRFSTNISNFRCFIYLFIYYSILSNNWKYEEYFENFCIISE